MSKLKIFRKLLKYSFEYYYYYLYQIKVKFKSYCFPDFICIGAQKAGTTWLMNNLKAHQDVYLPDVLPHYDIHFFDLYLKKGLGFYSTFFKDKNDKISGENTPAYGFMSNIRIKLVKKIMPNVKIIFIARDQKERALSHAKMNLKNSSKKIENNIVIEHFFSKKSIVKGNYYNILNKWTKFFSKDQILLINYSDIKNNPKEVISSVFNFLNLSLDINWENIPFDKIYNSNRDIEINKTVSDELEKLYSKPHLEVFKDLQNIINKN
ncbi:MAG: sulfotransferase family protein [Bacteroidota bacterium]